MSDSNGGATAPAVACVVLNFNGRDMTAAAVRSLRAMTYPRFEVMVVDNGSTDGSFAALAAAFPGIDQVRTEENLGGAGGYALGMRHAIARGGFDYVMLLNNDIEVDPEMLTELVRSAESAPDVACAGPKAYYHADRDRLWSAGGVLRFAESVTRERGMRETDRGQYDRTGPVDYINGCAILMKVAALRAVGLWDPVFFLSADDADWCMRARRKGFRCLYVHTARLWHMVEMTTGGYTAKKNFFTGRSMAIFVRRHARWWNWLTWLLAVAGAFPVAYLREMRRGNQDAAVAKIRGMREGLRMRLDPPPPWPAGTP